MASGREQEHLYKMRRLQVLSNMWQRFMSFCCVCAVCTCLVFCIRAMAGKVTIADLAFKVMADLKADRSISLIVSWILTGGTTGWAVAERRLRKRHIARVSSEASEMQSLIDPKRRSSNLSKAGETALEDI